MSRGLSSWLAVEKDADFPLDNLPFGIFEHGGKQRAGSALGDYVIDLALLQEEGFFKDIALPEGIFRATTLNAFFAQGRAVMRAVRERLIELFARGADELSQHDTLCKQVLVPQKEVRMQLPVAVGDYTDFYSSKEHASNVGALFRDPTKPLLPNWTHMPVGYHGRASSIVCSGTPIRRPLGQYKLPEEDHPRFGPTRRLDFELEMAFIACKPNPLGACIPIQQAEEHIAGLVLFNDWSARDIQAWEYVPLGPFLGKSFASSISPWVITLDALEPFRVQGPMQDVPVLPYLSFSGKKSFDIQLEASICASAVKEEALLCRTNFKYMYWNMSQQLAHHTVNGCNVRVGDMFASGTISGKEPGSQGSLLEITHKGQHPVALPHHVKRTFIEDEDTIIMRAQAICPDARIGFGEVRGTILPAHRG